MAIDAHAHIFTEGAHRAYMQKAAGRVDKIISILSEPALDDAGNEFPISLHDLLSFAASHLDIAVVGAVNTQKDISPQLAELEGFLKEKKIVGIKMYPGYEHFYASDKIVFPVAELCQKYNAPLIFHTGDVDDSVATSVLKYSHPIHVDELAVTYPECKIIIAHFGFPYLLEAANVVSKNKNVFTDISATIVQTKNTIDAENLLNQYIVDLKRVFAYFPDIRRKVMFGTDYVGEFGVLNEVGPYFKIVEDVFTPEEREHALSGLVKELFSLSEDIANL